jgi:hypothetical protein
MGCGPGLIQVRTRIRVFSPDWSCLNTIGNAISNPIAILGIFVVGFDCGSDQGLDDIGA